MKAQRNNSLLFKINFAFFVGIAFTSFFAPITRFSIAGRHFGIPFYLSVVAYPLFLLSYLFSFRKKDSLDNFASMFLAMLGLLALSSLGMALIQCPRTLGMYQTNTLAVWLELLVKYAYDLFSLFYALYFIRYATKKGYRVFFYVLFGLWIFLGAVQYIVFKANSPTLNSIYDKINFLGIFQSTELMARIRNNYGHFRMYSFASEPSTNAPLLSCVFLPTFVWEWKDAIANKAKPKRIVWLSICTFLLIVFTYLTKSSSVLVGCLFLALVLLICFLASKSVQKNWKINIVYFGIVLAGIVLGMPKIGPTIQSGITKLFDHTNGSTQYRYSTVWNDFLIFLKMPLFGCGDGLQGYYYAKHVGGTWMAWSGETIDSMTGVNGLLDGGPGIPSLISGFGLFGILVIGYVGYRYVKWLMPRNAFFHNEIEKSLLIGSVCTLAFLMFVSDGLHRNYTGCLIFAAPGLMMWENYVKVPATAQEVTRQVKVTRIRI